VWWCSGRRKPASRRLFSIRSEAKEPLAATPPARARVLRYLKTVERMPGGAEPACGPAPGAWLRACVASVAGRCRVPALPGTLRTRVRSSRTRRRAVANANGTWMSRAHVMRAPEGSVLASQVAQLSRDMQQLSMDRFALSMDRQELSVDRFALSMISKELSVDRFPLSMDGKKLSVDRFPLSMDGKELSVDRFPLSMDGKELSVDRFPLSMDGKELSVDRFPLSRDSKELIVVRFKLSFEGQP
jgi:hypothetical protein